MKKKRVWCHLENCKPINQWGIIPGAERKWPKEPACRGSWGLTGNTRSVGSAVSSSGGHLEPEPQEWSSTPFCPSSLRLPPPTWTTSEGMLYPKGLYRSSLMWTLGVSFSNSYLWVQLHRILFIIGISFIKARAWWFCQFLLLTDEIVLSL